MKRMAMMALICVLLAGLAGCGNAGTPAQYDTEGIAYLAFSDIDSVCEDPALTQAGRDLLSAQGDSLLLSYVVDSAILLTPEELGGFDHLVMVSPQWVERFGRPDSLRPVELDASPGLLRQPPVPGPGGAPKRVCRQRAGGSRGDPDTGGHEPLNWDASNERQQSRRALMPACLFPPAVN